MRKRKTKKHSAYTRIVRRGEVFYADLGETTGSEQGGIRPVVIIQNNIGNKYSPTVIVASLTSNMNKAKIPTHIKVGRYDNLEKDSIILLEQIRTLDKKKLKEYRCSLKEEDIKKIDKGIITSLGL